MTQHIVPLFGTGNEGRSKFVSDQRRINLYAEAQKDPDKSALPLFQRPGLKPYSFSRSPALVAGPFRGMQFVTFSTSGLTGVNATRSLVFVEGNQIWNLAESGEATPYGGGVSSGTPMTTTNGPVQIADNGLQVVLVDGSNGYLFQYNTGVPPPTNGAGIITDPDFPIGPSSIAFIAGRFIVNDPTHQGRFYWSALYDGSAWDGLDFATAESSPDPLSCVFEAGGQLLLIGTNTTEFWAPQVSGAPFARVGGSGIDWGTTARNTVRKYQGGVVLLARNLGGARQVIIISGYTPQVISTPDVEAAINADPAPDAATATVTTVDGHAFYVLNMSGTSWAYNGQTGTWDEWQTAGSRWAGNYIAQAFAGSQFVSDYRDDSLYTLEPDYLYDGAEYIARETVSRHLFNDYERFSVNKLTVDAQVGKASVVPRYFPWWPVFVGTNQGATSSNVCPTGASGTIECWFRALDTSGTQGLLTKLATVGWSVFISSSLLRFVDTGGNGAQTAYTSTFTDDHCAFTYDDTAHVMRIYVNGVLVDTETVTTTAFSSTATDFHVGSFADPTHGNVGDVRVWNYVRSADQIAANMYAQFGPGTPGLVTLFNDFNNTSLVFPNRGSGGGTLTFMPTVFEPRMNQYYSGTPRAPQIMLQVSRDNGNTWGNELWQSMGEVGDYKHRIVWNRLGRGRDFLFKLRVTDPVPLVITGGAVAVQ